MGFQFQTDGKRTEEEENFRQSDHTGAMSEVKTSDNEKHLQEGQQEVQEQVGMYAGSLGGPAADNKSIQKDR